MIWQLGTKFIWTDTSRIFLKWKVVHRGTADEGMEIPQLQKKIIYVLLLFRHTNASHPLETSASMPLVHVAKKKLIWYFFIIIPTSTSANWSFSSPLVTSLIPTTKHLRNVCFSSTCSISILSASVNSSDDDSSSFFFLLGMVFWLKTAGNCL